MSILCVPTMALLLVLQHLFCLFSACPAGCILHTGTGIIKKKACSQQHARTVTCWERLASAPTSEFSWG